MRVYCPNCGAAPERDRCTPTRCNTDSNAPWRYEGGRLVDRQGDVVRQDRPYFRGIAVLMPDLDQIVRTLAAAKTVGDVKRLRPWADALVAKLEEARAIRPGAGQPAAALASCTDETCARCGVSLPLDALGHDLCSVCGAELCTDCWENPGHCDHLSLVRGESGFERARGEKEEHGR